MKSDEKKNLANSSWVLNTAHFARIELNSLEEKKFAKQLGAVLDNFKLLNEVETKNIEPTAQVTGRRNVYRNDEIKNPSGKKLRDELLANTPDTENGSIKVPEVFG